MKNFFLVLSIVFIFAMPAYAGDYEFYVFGVNLKWIKNSDWKMITLGAVSSVVAHELGHISYVKYKGYDCKRDGLDFYTTGMKGSDLQNLGRAGFVVQTGIGLLLTSFEKTRHSDFTRGWTGVTAFQLGTYPIRYNKNKKGDFHLIDKGGGNADLEYGIFSAITIHNLLRQEW